MRRSSCDQPHLNTSEDAITHTRSESTSGAPSARRQPSEIAAVARQVAQAFGAVLNAATDGDVRTSKVVTGLGLDKSLASKLARSVEAGDPLQTINELPSPQGLRLALTAAREHGVKRALLDDAQASVEVFETLLASFVGGRADLDAVVAGMLPEARTRTERAARQAVFRAMGQLLGLTVDAFYAFKIYRPSAVENRLDVTWCSALDGVRCFTPDGDLTVLGVRSTPETLESSRTVTLDGVDATDSLAAHVLPAFSSVDPDVHYTARAGDTAMLRLPLSALPLAEPVSLAMAGTEIAGDPLLVHGSMRYHRANSANRRAIRAMVWDHFVRDDTFADPAAVFTVRHAGGVPLTLDAAPGDPDVEALNHAVDTVDLGTGAGSAASADFPAAADLVAHVFERLGEDPARYTGTRMRTLHPMPGAQFSAWFRLRDR